MVPTPTPRTTPPPNWFINKYDADQYRGPSYTDYANICLPDIIPTGTRATYTFNPTTYFPGVHLSLYTTQPFVHARVQTETVPRSPGGYRLGFLDNNFMCMGVFYNPLFYLDASTNFFARYSYINPPFDFFGGATGNPSMDWFEFGPYLCSNYYRDTTTVSGYTCPVVSAAVGPNPSPSPPPYFIYNAR